MRTILATFSFIFLFTQLSFAQSIIYGTVTDVVTNEQLPFATISFSGTTIGTISNGQGQYSLQIPDPPPSESVTISYIGYESKTFLIEDLKRTPEIVLSPSITQLKELVILPLSAEEYLRRAIRKYPVNYASKPFSTQAYYREVFTENNQYVVLNEGVFRSSYPNFQDTIPNLHQLVLFREKSEKDQIDFMKQWVEEKNEKEKKKALKKGEEWDEENEEARDIIQMGFGGPEQILKMDLAKNSEMCLDTTKFKKFRYSFGQVLDYQGHELMEILFESKGTVEHERMTGTIFLDIASDAIIGVEYEGKLVIPAVVKPILLAFGLSIKDPRFSKKIRYQYMDGKWYPDTFQWNVSTGLKKRYVFKTNEDSYFTGHQIFKVNELAVGSTHDIPDSLTFDPEKDPKTQVKPIGIDWANINTLPVEKLSNR